MIRLNALERKNLSQVNMKNRGPSSLTPLLSQEYRVMLREKCYSSYNVIIWSSQTLMMDQETSAVEGFKMSSKNAKGCLNW